MNWQIQEAKARFSEMVERAIKDGPQTVTRHGKPVAVLVPAEQYRRLRSKGKSAVAATWDSESSFARCIVGSVSPW